MGYRLAEAAWERGAEVVLISGPVALPAPIGVTLRRVETTQRARGRGARRSCRPPTCWSWPRRRRTSGPATRATASAPATTARWRSRWSRPTTSSSATRGVRRAGERHGGLRAGDRGRAGQGAGQARAEGPGPHRGQRRARARRRASRWTPTAWRCSTATARRGSCRCSRSGRWPRRSSTPWSRPLADERRRYLAQQIELGGAEIILGRVPARSAGRGARPTDHPSSGPTRRPRRSTRRARRRRPADAQVEEGRAADSRARPRRRCRPRRCCWATISRR